MDRNDCWLRCRWRWRHLSMVFVTSFLMLVWLCQFWKLRQSKGWKVEPAKKLRQLRARTPHDCPYCRQRHTSRCERVVRRQELRNPGCAYLGIRNQNLHALIRYGAHGKCERISDFYCQACGNKVTSRWETLRNCVSPVSIEDSEQASGRDGELRFVWEDPL